MLHLAFFVAVPVTLDRSLTIFMLGELHAAKTGLSETEISTAFVEQYVVAGGAVARRIHEQSVSGNIATLGRRPVGVDIAGQEAAVGLPDGGKDLPDRRVRTWPRFEPMMDSASDFVAPGHVLRLTWQPSKRATMTLSGLSGQSFSNAFGSGT